MRWSRRSTLSPTRSRRSTREKVDLILSDVRLPGERDGIDLARVAKERGIPVLFVDRQCARRGERAGGRLPDEAV